MLIDAAKLTEGYFDKVKAAEKELRRLERQSNKLAKQEQEQDERRATLDADLHRVHQTIARLESERESLKGAFVESQFEGNAQEQRRISSRRAEIDRELAQAQDDERSLCESLDALGPLDRDAALAAIQLDAIKTGNAFVFVEQLRQALVKQESDLRSRIDKARKALPKYSYETLRSVKEATDEVYAERKQRQEDERERLRAMERARQEKARYTYQAATENGVIVGWRKLDEAGNQVGYEQATYATV